MRIESPNRLFSALRRPSAAAPRMGFTLVELMIALALVLVLILGINEVFRLTSETIGSGQASAAALRDQRAAEQIMSDDFANAAPDAPFFIIRNQAVAAFNSQTDKLSNAGLRDILGKDVSASPQYIDQDHDGVAKNTIAGEIASPAIPNSRMHRIDSVTLFVRRPMSRATGNISSFVAGAGNLSAGASYSDLLGSTTANEAMVSYGHLRVANNSFTYGTGIRPATDIFFDPGEADDVNSNLKNDNNQFATQWILGRNQMLMIPRLTGPGSQQYPGETAYCPLTPGTTATQANAARLLTPLSMKSGLIGYAKGTVAAPGVIDPTTATYGLVSGESYTQVYRPGTAIPASPQSYSSYTAGIWESKLDLAVGSIAWFGQRFGVYRANYADPNYKAAPPTPATTPWPWYLPAVSNHADAPAGRVGDQYVGAFPPGGVNAPQDTFVYRGSTVPFASRSQGTSPIDPLGQTLAQTHPVLLPRVSQFIVEYAGDFISQDPATGTILPYDSGGARPDGEVDYVTFRNQKRIRWYGLPRYTGSGNVITASGGYFGPVVQGTAQPVTGTTLGQPAQVVVNGTQTPNSNNMPDVVPLSDLLSAIGDEIQPKNVKPGARLAASFERVVMSRRLGVGTMAPYRLSARGGDWLLPQANYADPSSGFTAVGNPGSSATNSPPPANATNANNANYICAWAGGGPKMIRITITLEDPNPKNLSGGRTFEYIYNLPY